MIKQIKKITKNKLDLFSPEEHQLSIQLCLDGFSFCIHNVLSNELVAFNRYDFDEKINDPFQHLELVKNVFSEETLLNHKYKNISVSHYNNLVTQVPKPLFDKNQLQTYLRYSIKTLENDFITFDEIENSEIVNVYIPFVNINNFLIEIYGPFVYKHASTILIEGLLKEFKNHSEPCCFVNVSSSSFEVVVFKDQKLELYNCFDYQTKEDFIYYILFTAEQLNLNPEEFELKIMGEIEKDSELFEILYQYVRNITFYNPSNFPELLKNESPHSNYVVLNQF